MNNHCDSHTSAHAIFVTRRSIFTPTVFTFNCNTIVGLIAKTIVVSSSASFVLQFGKLNILISPLCAGNANKPNLSSENAPLGQNFMCITGPTSYTMLYTNFGQAFTSLPLFDKPPMRHICIHMCIGFMVTGL